MHANKNYIRHMRPITQLMPQPNILIDDPLTDDFIDDDLYCT
jgi:hypothetical protein